MSIPGYELSLGEEQKDSVAKLPNRLKFNNSFVNFAYL